VLDLAWLAAFGVVLTLMLLESPDRWAGDGGVALELTPGEQRLGLYHRGQRLGSFTSRTRRQGDGWRLETRIRIDGRQAARTRMRLKRDLSLGSFDVEADLVRLVKIKLGSMASSLLGQGRGRLRVSGHCALETGICRLRGRVAGQRIDLPVLAGRGPVLTSAVYPLLARGDLGREAELGLFDPLSMQRRLVTFRVEARQRLRLRSGRALDAVRVSRDLEGMATHVWLDPRGRVLREELPLGLVLEHESFGPVTDEEGHDP
jgi:hypothetical protein